MRLRWPGSADVPRLEDDGGKLGHGRGRPFCHTLLVPHQDASISLNYLCCHVGD